MEEEPPRWRENTSKQLKKTLIAESLQKDLGRGKDSVCVI